MIEEIRNILEDKAHEDERIGLLTVKPANKWVADALLQPDPITWFHGMIVARESTVIFASSNVGKSILAVQIAEEISQAKTVLYVDLELSDKQFQMRYSDGQFTHIFPDTFMRAEICPDQIMDMDLEASIIDSVERAVKEGAEIVIIDNLTYVCNCTEKAEAAGRFMNRLNRIKRSYGATILVIAHTPKRYGNSPLGLYDLAGSARLINLFDAGIAMARSAKDSNLRYIKQVKVRTGAMLYDGDHVMVCEVIKESGWVHFRILGYEDEADHLPSSSGVDEMLNDATRLVKEGKSVRSIESTLGISHGKAQRLREKVLKRIQDDADATVPLVPHVQNDTSDTNGTERCLG